MRKLYGICLIGLNALLCCCSAEHAPYGRGSSSPEGSVPVQFSLSVQDGGVRTKTIAEVSQSAGVFRGIEDVFLIPFAKRGRIEAGDTRTGYCSIPEGVPALNARNNSQLYERKWVPRNTASFLFYGKSFPYGGTKAVDGSLVASGLDGTTAGEITFSPDPILGEAPSEEKMQAILEYLNAIAATVDTYNGSYSWNGFSSNAELSNLFQTFINGGRVMAGSSGSIRSLVELIYDNAESLSLSSSYYSYYIRDGILKNILSHGVTRSGGRIELPYNMSDYPGAGLPDGSAAVKWNGTKFVSGEDTGVLIARADRFCYPAALWYYANSRVNTTENAENTYLSLNYGVYTQGDTYDTWGKILSKYEKAPGVVEPETVGAALIDPVRYGVGLFQVTVSKLSGNSLLDGNSNYVALDNSHFPVTGLIIGGQRVQSFNFTPIGVDDYYIYDTDFSSIAYLSSTQEAKPLQTLVFESPEDAVIHFAIEFQNNSSSSFEGATSSVLPGGRFYLLGDLNLQDLPESQRMRDGELVRKVFEKGRITPVKVSVNSLKYAYNTIPDLRDPQLQIGITAMVDWVMPDPADVPLY